ncbi:RNA polymerase II transcription factor SIII subunit A-domain-containing protein [Lipomyces arxii]|uniref:RNA polymerase II transcription factor SIII subunit A-domain-containing protein n=1 Tax=Lipomyces arxii TaxID=56418 RepID=UPI0034CDD17D
MAEEEWYEELGFRDVESKPNQPLSLFRLSLNACFANSNRIMDIGDIRYDLVKPVLSEMGPNQLLTIEQNSPHIKPDSDELWTAILQRTFSQEEIGEYNSIKKNRDVRVQYAGMMKARARRIQKASDKVRAQYDNLQKDKQKKQIVALDIFQDPGEVRKRQRRIQQEKSSGALKKMSIVERARIETASNPLFSPSNMQFRPADSYPVVSAEEAARRRQEKMDKRMADAHQKTARQKTPEEPEQDTTKPVDVKIHKVPVPVVIHSRPKPTNIKRRLVASTSNDRRKEFRPASSPFLPRRKL